ncbi:MAG: hypothetical protein JJ897_16860 [Marinibacterium sp.]|nr:hypothetical protein [Marinibacterium sp.]
MGWFALWHPDGTVFDSSAIIGGVQTLDALVVRGTILLETCLTPGTNRKRCFGTKRAGRGPCR